MSMRGVRWQWWVIIGSTLLLVAAPPTRDMLKMQAAGVNPKADYYLWYPLWSSDKDLLKLASVYRFVLRGGVTSPMAGAARRLHRKAERQPDDFIANWGAARFLPEGEPHLTVGWKPYAEAARRLAARFPDRQEAWLLRARVEIDALPQWPEWYRPGLEQVFGDPGKRKGRLVTDAEAAPALQALAEGMERFPDNAFWQVGMAGVYFQVGRDSDGLKALEAAARKPRFDLAGAEGFKLSVQAARESGIPYPEAFDVPWGAGSAAHRIMRIGMTIQALAEKAAEQGQRKKAAEYCVAGTEVGDLSRRTSRSLTEAIVGILFVSRGAGEVAVPLPTKEAENREPLPGAKGMPIRQGQQWYKGRLYNAVREEAGQRALNELLNQLYAANSMGDVVGSYRRRLRPESEAYLRKDVLSWHFMVAGAGLLALAASLLVLCVVVRLWWVVMRRPQGGLGAGWQAVVVVFSFAAAGAMAVWLAARAGLLSSGPVFARAAWLLPVSLMAMLAVTAAVRTRALTAPERGMGRCLVGLLHQVAANAVLVVVIAYLALAVPTAVIRHRMTAWALPYYLGGKTERFRQEMGWDETKVRYPFPVSPVSGRAEAGSPGRHRSLSQEAQGSPVR
jgi:hypothetical protein